MTTIYNVHIYREMRLVYGGIEANSHEEAAAIARDRLTDDADSIEDCDGETMAALVDVQGDEDYRHSRAIDFEGVRERKAASRMLAALTWLLDDLADAGEDRNPETGEAYDSVAFARAAKAAAEPVVSRSEQARAAGYFVGASGRRYTYAEIADRIRSEAPHTLGKHIFVQLEAIGLLEEMEKGTTPCGLPFTFADESRLIEKQLTSNGMFHTPGFFRALQNDYRIKGEPRRRAVGILSEGYGLPREEAEGLLSGAIEITIDEAGGTITYSIAGER